MESREISLDPITNSYLKLQLFENVKNLEALHKKVITGQLQCCVMKASLIIDPMQVVIAANKAAVARQQGSLITKTVHTEILFNLSITKNVTKSLSHFGMDHSCDSLLVAIVFKPGEDWESVLKDVEGDAVNVSELCKVSDKMAIRKTYAIGDGSDETLLNSIVNKIVTKGF